MEIAVRPAREEDLPAIVEIYNHYVVSSHSTFDVEPVTLEDRRIWFSHYAPAGPHRLLVADRQAEVVGYATSSKLRPKPAYSTSVETSVYVAPGALGRGIGRALYADLLEKLGGEDVHRAFAGIALPNPASVALHARFGFTSLGVFREVGRKFGRYWSVEWFERPVR